MNNHERRELERQTQNMIDNQTILNRLNAAEKGPSPIPHSLTRRIRVIQEEVERNGANSAGEEARTQVLVRALASALVKVETQNVEQANYLKVLEGQNRQHSEEMAELRQSVLKFKQLIAESAGVDSDTLAQLQRSIESLGNYLDKFATAVMKAVQDIKVQPNAALEREVLLLIKEALDQK